MRIRRRTRASLAALAVLAGVVTGACSDEDGDGATTDEEVEDVQQESNEAEDRVNREVDGQNQGSNNNE